tara:strand:- start:104 stop:520 length:417 start_codon:yes stop_codon:yes gene_type:complete
MRSGTYTISTIGQIDDVAGGENNIVSISLPKKCKEFRFKINHASNKNFFAYSFDPFFSKGTISVADLDGQINSLGLVQLNNIATTVESVGFFGFTTEEIIFRNPDPLPPQIYIFPVTVTQVGNYLVSGVLIGGENDGE